MKVLDATAPRFDWYSATFDPDGRPSKIFESLIDEDPRPTHPRLGYSQAWELRRGGSTIGRVMAGGMHDLPHVVSSGADAAEVAAVLRDGGVDHSVARADACVDVEAPGAFALIEGRLLEDLPQRVTRTRYEKIQNGETASTLYLGSKKSETFGRIYEKGKESPDRYHPDTVRLEVQTRPNGPGRKSWAALASPHEVMSLPAWSTDVLGMVGLERLDTPVRARRKSDLEGALDACIAQYGQRLLELLAVHGGDVDSWSADLLDRLPVRAA